MEGHIGKIVSFSGLTGKFEKMGHIRKRHFFQGHIGKYLTTTEFLMEVGIFDFWRRARPTVSIEKSWLMAE
jgi:hypothetical protein